VGKGVALLPVLIAPVPEISCVVGFGCVAERTGVAAFEGYGEFFGFGKKRVEVFVG